MTDEQAMWRLVAREDHQAFATVVERWEEPIRRLCIRLIGDAHRGEDLKQEIFVRVFIRRHDFRPERKFSTWLWRIALNACYDELRRRQRRGEECFEEEASDLLADPASLASKAPKPDEQAAIDDESVLVRDALMQLPEELRTVLVLRHYEGLKFREIAEILETPEGTVVWRASEALTRMHGLLAEKLGRAGGSQNVAPAAPLRKPASR